MNRWGIVARSEGTLYFIRTNNIRRMQFPAGREANIENAKIEKANAGLIVCTQCMREGNIKTSRI